MKADAITVGGTYWDRGKGLRKVLEMGVDAYGVRTLRYKLLSGKANGQPLRVESDGHRVFGCKPVIVSALGKRASHVRAGCPEVGWCHDEPIKKPR